MKTLRYLSIICLLALGCWACEEEEVRLVPSLSFGDDLIVCAENDGTIQIPLKLTGALDEDAVIAITVVEGTEQNGQKEVNYKVPAYIALAAGSVRGVCNVQIIDDQYPNEDRIFKIQIAGVSGRVVTESGMQTCEVHILDNDRKRNVTVGFPSATLEFREDLGVIEVPVVVKGILSDSIYVNFATEDGSALAGADFELLDRRIKIVERETWGVVRIQVTDYKNSSIGDRSFVLRMTSVEGANPQDTTVSIRENLGACEITVKKVSRELGFAVKEVRYLESAGRFALPVQLSAPIDRELTFTIGVGKGATAMEGEHYTIDKKQFTIPRGETMVNAYVNVIDDRLGNDHRFCDFTIASMSIEGMNEEEMSEYVGLSNDSVVRLTIENDDASVGFKNSEVFCWMGDNIKVPVSVDGLREERLMISMAVKHGQEVVENRHFIILSKEITVNAGDKEVCLEVATLVADELQNYELEFQIVNLRGLDLSNNTVIDKNATKCTLKVMKADVRQLDKNGWTAVSNTNSGGGSAPEIIDGNINTIWHSKWNSGGSATPYPQASDDHWVIVDMQEELFLTKIEIIPRQAGGGIDIFQMVCWISEDKETWHKIGDTGFYSGRFPKAGVTMELNFNRSGRYLKLVPTGNTTPNYTANFAEVNLWGILAN